MPGDEFVSELVHDLIFRHPEVTVLLVSRACDPEYVYQGQERPTCEEKRR